MHNRQRNARRLRTTVMVIWASVFALAAGLCVWTVSAAGISIETPYFTIQFGEDKAALDQIGAEEITEGSTSPENTSPADTASTEPGGATGQSDLLGLDMPSLATSPDAGTDDLNLNLDDTVGVDAGADGLDLDVGAGDDPSDPLDDTVDEIEQTVEETVDEVEETVDEVVDDAQDEVDDLLDGLLGN